MRRVNQTIMYDDNEDIPASHNTIPLENTPSTHSISKWHVEATAKYNDDYNPQHYLAEFQEHFQQL